MPRWWPSIWRWKPSPRCSDLAEKKKIMEKWAWHDHTLVNSGWRENGEKVTHKSWGWASVTPRITNSSKRRHDVHRFLSLSTVQVYIILYLSWYSRHIPTRWLAFYSLQTNPKAQLSRRLAQNDFIFTRGTVARTCVSAVFKRMCPWNDSEDWVYIPWQ